MYPPNFSAQDARDGDNSWFHRTMICHCTPETIGGFNGPVVIEVVDNPKGQSIEEILKSVFGFQGDPQFKSLMVGGIASKRTTVLPGLIPSDSVFLSKGDKIFYISLVGNPSQIDVSTMTFNQILSTFKFITP